MAGIFCRDIWGIIFDLLEKNFDPLTLNNLSATCRKLHDIDMQRRQSYIKQYEKHGPLIEKLKEKRQDYVQLIRYAAITCHFYKYYYFQVTFKHVIQWLSKDQTFQYQQQLTKMTQEEIVNELLEKTKVKQFKNNSEFSRWIELIKCQISAPDYCYVFTYIKQDGDIVNAIMDLQF